jgi:transposase-like protein
MPERKETPEAGRKATTERRCPYCQSADQIKALGQVSVYGGWVRALYCCADCDRAFLFCRKPFDFKSQF